MSTVLDFDLVVLNTDCRYSQRYMSKKTVDTITFLSAHFKRLILHFPSSDSQAAFPHLQPGLLLKHITRDGESFPHCKLILRNFSLRDLRQHKECKYPLHTLAHQVLEMAGCHLNNLLGWLWMTYINCKLLWHIRSPGHLLYCLVSCSITKNNFKKYDFTLCQELKMHTCIPVNYWIKTDLSLQ